MSRADEFPDPHQREVLEHTDGALVVLAPAGSGKTRVIAERLALAIERGRDPKRALCVTFTNRAAREMRERVRTRLDGRSKDVRISTFHALCAWILRLEARAVGFPQDFVVYDEADCAEILHAVGGLVDSEARDAFQRLAQAKSQARPEDLSLGAIPDRLFRDLDPRLARDYHATLAAHHALDFADLVYRVRAVLALDPGVAARWSGRFDWVQIDEVQDTHHSEFDVIRAIARGCSSIALFGDLDQTIYEWRGSDPDGVLGAFEAAFGPTRPYALTCNYRSTRRLVTLAETFKGSFRKAATRLVAAGSLPEGVAPRVIYASDGADEADRIARDVKARAGNGERIGILVPKHVVAQAVSDGLTRHGVPHVTVEQFEFFRRQEIKDALARTRLLLNPRDATSARRLVLRPPRGIGEGTLRKLREEGPACHLRLADLLAIETHREGEPYGKLLRAWHEGEVVVLDVESTGLDTARDEVVEIAALRRRPDGTSEAFHRFVRPTRPVGESERTHGHSDAHLAAHGEEASVVLRDLAGFVEGAVVVAHNASYDVGILRSHAARAGVRLEFPDVADTYDLSRRLWHLERYDLGSLCGTLGTVNRPTHRAMDDVRATVELLERAVAELAAGARKRAALVAEHGARFRPLAEELDTWRGLAESLRPADLMRRILEGSGLLAHYADETRRLEHLDRLLDYLRSNDDPDEAPRDALDRLARNAALARNVDHLDEDDPRIPVITIHQAKGLEFDGVYVAGVIENGIPSYFAIQDDKIEEQRRLFYVALTRPKKWIVLSWSGVNERGYRAKPSRFLEDAGVR